MARDALEDINGTSDINFVKPLTVMVSEENGAFAVRSAFRGQIIYGEGGTREDAIDDMGQEMVTFYIEVSGDMNLFSSGPVEAKNEIAALLGIPDTVRGLIYACVLEGKVDDEL